MNIFLFTLLLFASCCAADAQKTKRVTFANKDKLAVVARVTPIDPKLKEIRNSASSCLPCLVCCCCCGGLGYLCLCKSPSTLKKYARRSKTSSQDYKLYTCCWDGVECGITGMYVLCCGPCIEESCCPELRGGTPFPCVNCDDHCPPVCRHHPCEGGCNNMCCWKLCPDTKPSAIKPYHSPSSPPQNQMS